MSIQTQRTINVYCHGHGEFVETEIPTTEKLIQTIYTIEKGSSALPSVKHLQTGIKAIHESNEHAQIIVVAPVLPEDLPQPTNQFEQSASDHNTYYVTDYKSLQKAGLHNFAQVKKDANAIRDQLRKNRRLSRMPNSNFVPA